MLNENINNSKNGFDDFISEFKEFKQNMYNRIGNNEANLKTLEKDFSQKFILNDRPDFKAADIKGAETYDSEFSNYIRTGQQPNEMKFMSISNNEGNDGGLLVSEKFMLNIINHLNEYNIIRQYAAVEKISTDSLDIINDNDNCGASWSESETSKVNETETPKFAKHKIMVHELYAQPMVTQKLIDDSMVDIDQWLVNKISLKFAELEEEAFIKGDGKSKPTGILAYKASNETKADNNNKIKLINASLSNYDSIIKAIYQLDFIYHDKAILLVNPLFLEKLYIVKDNNGAYLLNKNIESKNPLRICGIPIIASKAVPYNQAGENIIILGNLNSGYQIVDRYDMRLLRDPYTSKPFVKFYFTKRLGGDVKRLDAFKIISFT